MSFRSWFTRVAVGALAASVVVLPLQAAPPARAASCPDFVFVAARGSAEDADYASGNLGMGKILKPVYDELQNRVRAAGRSMTPSVVHYDAAGDKATMALKAAHVGIAYDNSVAGGVKDASSRIANAVPSGCSGTTKVVVAGYSQGAQVVGQALADLPASSTSSVIGTALFGDPYFNADDTAADYSSYSPDHYGVLSVRGPWSGTVSSDVASYCHDGDPICNVSKPVMSAFGATLYVRDLAHIYSVTKAKGEGFFGEHENYQPSGDVGQAVDHLASLMKLGVPTGGTGGPTDVVFVIDSTGSMGGTISAVESNVVNLANSIASTSSSYRFALVDYKDDPGNDSAYQSRVDVPFTTDSASFATGVRSITATGGGDTPESMYGGVMTGLGLPWRPGVKKSVIVIGDAPGKDPEPVTGNTLSTVVAKAFAVDPAQIYTVPVTTDPSTVSFMKALSDGTGGTVTDGSNSSTFVASLEKALVQAGTAPTANVTADSSGVTGTAVKISAKGTFGSAADPIVGYDWNYGTGTAAGSYDGSSTTPIVTHTYPKAGTYTISLRARAKSGLSGLATTSIVITDPPAAKPSAVISASGNVAGTTAALTFTAGSGGGPVEYFAIKDKSGKVIDAFTPDPTSKTQEVDIPDFPANSTATYTVYAVNTAGISEPVTITVTSTSSTSPSPSSSPSSTSPSPSSSPSPASSTSGQENLGSTHGPLLGRTGGPALAGLVVGIAAIGVGVTLLRRRSRK